MRKNWKNGAKWPILRKSARATSAGLRNGLRVRQLACALVGGKTAARANRARAWRRGLPPSMGDRIKRFCAPESSLVVPLPCRPLAG